MENEYDYMRVPKDLAIKLKELENEDALYEKEVLKYVDRTKKDISNQVELLDDDVLMFKAKLASYKKAFKEAYESADTEMYSFWEDLDKKLSMRYKSMSTRTKNVTDIFDREFHQKKEMIDSLYKRMEHLNTYKFESILSFLKSFEQLDSKTKELFIGMIKD
jgi:hypothetical protein